MKKYTKSDTPYRTISLPNEQYTKIVRHISKRPHYSSIASFVKIAIDNEMRRDANLSGDVFGGVKIEHEELDRRIQDSIDKKLKKMFGDNYNKEKKKDTNSNGVRI